MRMTHPRPWTYLYEAGQPESLNLDALPHTVLHAFEERAARDGDAPCLHYEDRTYTHREVADLSDRMAMHLVTSGFAPGDRAAIFHQNIPQTAIAMIAIWKAGGTAVAANPMLKAKELRHHLDDSGATVLFAMRDLWNDVATSATDGSTVGHVVITAEGSVSEPSVESAPAGVTIADFEVVTARRTVPVELPGPGEIAVLTYTSGTTGPAKGAMNSHDNLIFNSTTFARWAHVTEDDVILGVAPLFHVTGLVAHIGLSLVSGAPLVLTSRFDPDVSLELIERHRVTFTIGAITVFVALARSASAGTSDVSSLTKVLSGGAAISASVIESIEQQFGFYVHSCYGLTETTSPTHAIPFGRRAPVDPESKLVSVGVPVFNTDAKIVDSEGATLGPGEVGEIVVAGPQIVPGYWNREAETRAAMHDGWFATGDIGFMDGDGWFYVVDRIKDMINASGYKVWPREVEEELLTHPGVREAAVVGVPDDYRGETVLAHVVVADGGQVTSEELIEYCRSRMAAYKYPREVVIVDELPRNAAGKVLRRELRANYGESRRV